MLGKRWGVFAGKFLVMALLLVLWGSILTTPVYAALKAVATDPVSAGVELQTYWYGGTKVYLLKVDLANKYVHVDTMVGADGTFSKAQNLTKMAERTGAVAGINGGFFQMKNHRSIGLVFKDGKLVASPAQRQDMPGFGITEDNRAIMDIFGFSGQVYAENGNAFPLFGINKPDYLLPTGVSADLNHLNLYNPLWGEKSREDISGQSGIVEVIVQNGEVVVVNQDKPGVVIPADGYVLEGHGAAAEFLLDNLPVGSRVEVEYTVTPESGNLRGAVGGNTLLVQDGQVAPFTQEIAGKHARSAVGTLPDGKTLYLVAAEKSAESAGMTQQEMAQFLVDLGVERAVNLDGGGSTTLAARHLGDFKVSLVNQPQRDWQRSLPEAIGVFSSAPKGRLSGLIISGPDVVLSGTSRVYAVKGYDKYYNPYQVDPEDVRWSATRGGKIEAGVFEPLDGRKAKIVARVNRIRAEKTIEIIESEDLAVLNVEPAAIMVKPGSEVPVKVSVETKSGDVFDLTPEDIQVALSGKVGTLTGTTFSAGEDLGVGEITVSFQGLTKVIPVIVHTPGSTVRQMLPENSTLLELDEDTGLEFPAGSVEDPLYIEVESVDNVEIPGYKVLKVIDVASLQGEASSLAVPWRLQYGYSREDTVVNTVYEQAAVGQTGSEETGAKFDPADVLIPEDKRAAETEEDIYAAVAEVETVGAMVLYKGVGSSKWVPQPAWLERTEQDNRETVMAKIKGLGQVAVVVDENPAPTFTDLKGHWSEKIVAEMASRGVVTGYPNGSFQPEKQITRAEFVSLLCRGLLWSKTEKQSSFKDEIPVWAADAVAAAVDRKAVSGYPDGTFRPSRGISRTEMAVIIDRILHLPEILEQQEQVFSDAGTIPDWAVDKVNRVAAAGILNGDNGKFRPEDSATRAEVAVSVSRVLAYWVKH